MRLLIVTQVVDSEDLYLGFFHRWIEELAPRFERVEVICLKEGRHTFPDNVHVHSLGKEKGGGSPLRYAVRFLQLAWGLRNEYDSVFVHMNQEYLLVAGWLWGVLGKSAYLWRNHYAGSWITDVAVLFCRKVFYTSKHSYTAKYKKAVRMPVGVDTARFHPSASIARVPNSILFFGRMTKSKRPELVLEALIGLQKRGVPFSASFVGSPLKGEERLVEALKQQALDAGLQERISFSPGVENIKAGDLYRAHQVYVNAGRSGMLDKTIFEAAASGCVVVAASEDWREIAGEEYWFDGSVTGFADKLYKVVSREKQEGSLNALIIEHSLVALGAKLAHEIY